MNNIIYLFMLFLATLNSLNARSVTYNQDVNNSSSLSASTAAQITYTVGKMLNNHHLYRDDEYHEVLIQSNENKVGSLPRYEYKIFSDHDHDIIKNLIRIDEKHIHYVKLENLKKMANATTNLILIESNSFVHAVNLAYSHHLPLIITPDIIWYLIASGVAVHVNNNAERLRSTFVNHEYGKQKITIRRDDFIFNSTNNPWNQVIDEFSAQLKNYTKANVTSLFENNFNTTTEESKLASKIVLMDAMQKYFDFEFVTLCGIPEIRVKGTKRDWISVKARFERMLDLMPELNVWANSLMEVLENFIEIYDLKINYKFWNEIYKIKGGSGGPYLSGWILSLFPYLRDGEKNYFVWEKNWREAFNTSFFGGLTTTQFPVPISKVNFKWKYFTEEVDMMLLGGLMSVEYDPTDESLRSIFGYAICENKLKSDPSSSSLISSSSSTSSTSESDLLLSTTNSSANQNEMKINN